MATRLRRWVLRMLGGLVVLAGLAASPASAATAPAASPEPTRTEAARPRIGLALSGGGARGLAHVGVLRVLEEMRVPVDSIAGTSMGAVVGGLYASGLSADEIEEALTSVDWTAIGEDELPRKDRVFRRKEDDQRYLMNLEIGLDGFVLPQGLRSGQRFTFELRRWTWTTIGVHDFSRLPTPFKAVAADLETGDLVILDRGSLPEAMRASMSIPGVFTPVELGGRLLVDGGILNNLPTDVVEGMGADVILAVDVGTPLLGRDQLDSMLAVTTQAMTISTEPALETLRSRADLLFSPQVAERGTLDFSDVRSLIAAGEAEARRHAERLRKLALSPEDYARYQEARRRPARETRPVRSIRIEGLERVDPRVVRGAMKTRVGAPLDLEVLRRDLGRIYGLGDFELVDFDVDAQDQDQGLDLVVRVRERPGGPFFFRNAFFLELDEDQHTSATVLLNLTAKRLNVLGGEWRTDLEVGSEQNLETSFYQPLDFAGHWFLEARGYAQRDLPTVFAGDGTLAELELLTTGVSLDAGVALERFGEIRLGAFRQRVDQRFVRGAGSGDLPAVDVGGLSAQLAVDTLDNIYFPRSGQVGVLKFVAARPALGSEDRFDVGYFSHVGAVSVGRSTWLAWLELGTPLGEDQPSYSWFRGGGFFSFSGYQRGELSGASFAVVRPTYIFRLGNLPSVAGRGIYLGGWLEAGNYWASRDDVSLDDLRVAATLTVGAETVIGPAYLAVGFAEGGRRQLTLSIGPSFSTRPR